jgi:hypothetical protein
MERLHPWLVNSSRCAETYLTAIANASPVLHGERFKERDIGDVDRLLRPFPQPALNRIGKSGRVLGLRTMVGPSISGITTSDQQCDLFALIRQSQGPLRHYYGQDL